LPTHEIVIPDWHPTPLNKLRTGRGYRKAARLKRQDANRIGFYFRVSGVPKASTKRLVSLRFVYEKGKRRHDEDAFLKTALDALVKCGALVNDSPNWLDFVKPVHEHGESKQTIITLEDL
jgi:hypothetical protein